MSSTFSSRMYPQTRRAQQSTGPSVGLHPLRSQVEFYFSPQNLAKDAFLQSQLQASDHIGAVHMDIICNFPKVRQINASLHHMGHLPLHMLPMADPRLVRMALQHSTVVTVSQDGAWISPIHSSSTEPTQSHPGSRSAVDERKTESSAPSSPSSQATASSSLGVPTHPLPPAADTMASRSERNVVILRDVPSTITREEVMQTFCGDGIVPKAARPDVGNTWFITFETEEQAVNALSSTHDKTIRNVPVRGCLKSDVKPISTVDGTSVTSTGLSKGNSVPLHVMSMTYPVVLPYMPAQHSHPSFGYVYSIPPQQGPMHVRSQFPHYYTYGYAHQGFLQPMVGGYPGSPSPIAHAKGRAQPAQVRGTDKVHPKPMNSQQQKNKKWQNRKKQAAVSEEETIPLKPDRIPIEASQPQNNVEKKGPRSKQEQHQEQLPLLQVKRKTKEHKIDMGADQFPALGSNSKPIQMESKLGGYAQALLKRPQKPSMALPHESSGVTTLDAEMGKFSLDVTTVCASDGW